MTKPFSYTIEVYGVNLDVTGEYDEAVPATRDDPGFGSLVDIGTVCVSGTKVNIWELLCPKTLESITNKIDRIESGL